MSFQQYFDYISYSNRLPKCRFQTQSILCKISGYFRTWNKAEGHFGFKERDLPCARTPDLLHVNLGSFKLRSQRVKCRGAVIYTSERARAFVRACACSCVPVWIFLTFLCSYGLFQNGIMFIKEPAWRHSRFLQFISHRGKRLTAQ